MSEQHFNENPAMRVRLDPLNKAIERVIADHNEYGEPIISDVSVVYHMPSCGNVLVNCELIPPIPETSVVEVRVQKSLDRDSVADAIIALVALISNIASPRVVTEGIQMALASIIGSET